MADGTGTRRPLIGELRVTEGPDAGKMFAVRDNMVVGREETADIVLTDASGELSRRHVRIRSDDGAPVIEDLGSTNGTFVNGERVLGTRALHTGDHIRVGASTLEFASAIEPQVTRARQIPDEAQLTRPRQIPDEARLTVAHQVPAGAAPPEELDRTFSPPGADGELRILSGPGAGAEAAVIGGSATIGREPECDLQVLDPEVSRRHAKVAVRDGAAFIDDLHSSNGTYINGERVLDRYQLAPGDRIQIGEATIGLTSPVFAGAEAHPAPAQVSALRDAVIQTPKLLTAESGSRKWWTLFVVSATTFMLLLDVTIVAVALPSISKSLHPSFSSLQWVVDAYTLMLTVALLTAGSLADMYGRKRLLLIGVVVFTSASVICAVAPNATVLDLARGLQGIGGAIMFACSLALIVQEFPAGERGVAFGIYGAVNGLSIAVGPILGGLLTQGIGWQSIFYLNVPVAIVALVILQLKVVNLPGPPARIDWGGLITFSGLAFLATFATIRGSSLGWTSPVILGCYGAAIVLLIAFIIIERRTEHPMLDLTLFRNSTFVGSSLVAITMSFALLGIVFFLTVWIQSVLGYSPIQAGLRMLTFTGTALLMGPIAGRMTETVSPRIVLTVGMVLVSGGILSMITVQTGSGWTAVLPGLLVSGLGMGLINPTLAATAVGVVPPWRSGMASGVNSTCREAGTTAGIAVLGTVLAHQVHVSVKSSLAGTAFADRVSTVADAINVGGTRQLVDRVPASSQASILHTAHLSYASGLRVVFAVACGVSAFGAIASIVLIRRKDLKYGAAAGGH